MGDDSDKVSRHRATAQSTADDLLLTSNSDIISRSCPLDGVSASAPCLVATMTSHGDVQGTRRARWLQYYNVSDKSTFISIVRLAKQVIQRENCNCEVST